MRIIKKLYIVSTVLVFAITCLTQILLCNSKIKSKISKLYEFESKYVYSEEIINDGYIIIKITNPSDNLFLLQNGEKIAVLNQSKITINVLDNSVIEVDGRFVETPSEVEIVSFSDNIDGYYEKKIETKSNITVLGRFFIK